MRERGFRVGLVGWKNTARSMSKASAIASSWRISGTWRPLSQRRTVLAEIAADARSEGFRRQAERLTQRPQLGWVPPLTASHRFRADRSALIAHGARARQSEAPHWSSRLCPTIPPSAGASFLGGRRSVGAGGDRWGVSHPHHLRPGADGAAPSIAARPPLHELSGKAGPPRSPRCSEEPLVVLVPWWSSLLLDGSCN